MTNENQSSESGLGRKLMPFICLAATAIAVFAGIAIQKSLQETADRVEQKQKEDGTSADEPETTVTSPHGAPTGFLTIAGRSDLVAIGRFPGNATFEVGQLLKDDGSAPATLEMPGVESDADGSPLSPDGRYLVALSQESSGDGVGEPWTNIAIRMGPVPLHDEEHAGVEELATAVLLNSDNPELQAKAYVDALEGDGPVARDMASIDMLRFRPIVEATVADDKQRVMALLKDLPANDPLSHTLIEIITSFSSPAAFAPELANLLRRDDANKLFEALAFAFRNPRLRDSAAAAFTLLTIEAEDPAIRRYAAYVLARADTESARASLTGLLDDADSDVAGEALVGVAGHHTERLEACLDVIRLHLNTESAPESEEPGKLDAILADREMRKERSSLNSGETFTLMASGYYVLRSGDEKRRDWLKKRIPLIDNPAAKAFLNHIALNQWADFDVSW